MRVVGLLQLLTGRRSQCNSYMDCSSEPDSPQQLSSSKSFSTSQYADRHGCRDEDLAFNRTPGLVLLLVCLAIATTICSVSQCALYLKVNQNPGKHLDYIDQNTRGSVTGVRG